jgi:hypothetical protein
VARRSPLTGQTTFRKVAVIANPNLCRLSVRQGDAPWRRSRQAGRARRAGPALPGPLVRLGIGGFRASDEATEKQRKEHGDEQDREKREANEVETTGTEIWHTDSLP